MAMLRLSERSRGGVAGARIDAVLPWFLQWKHGSSSAPGAGSPVKGGGIMCRFLRSFLAVALLAAFGATGAWALTPDDAIRLSEQGVDDLTIIAKICSDAEAWDLTADDILYLRDLGVSGDVIKALIDPASAAEKFGFTLGVATPTGTTGYGEPAETAGSSAYVYSLGYYYGPLARFYYQDPYFYPYMYSAGFSFGFSYWPWFYGSYCWPYSYGYYPYPYYWYPCDSYYYGYGYCGPYYSTYYGPPPPGGGNYYGDVRWRDPADHGPPAYGSEKPNVPEVRSRGSAGYDAPGSLAAKDPTGYSRAGGGERPSRSGVVSRGDGTQARGRLAARDPGAIAERGVARGDGSAGDGEYRSARGTRVIFGGKSSRSGQLKAGDPGRSYERRSGSNRLEGVGLGSPSGRTARREVGARDPGRAFARRDPGSGSASRRVAAGGSRGSERREVSQGQRSEVRSAPAPGRASVRQPSRGDGPTGGSVSRMFGSSPSPGGGHGGGRVSAPSGGGRVGGPSGGGGARGHR